MLYIDNSIRFENAASRFVEVSLFEFQSLVLGGNFTDGFPSMALIKLKSTIDNC